MRHLVRFISLCLLALSVAAAPAGAQSAQDPVYVFHTSVGSIAVQLYPDVTPQTVANFLRYVNAGSYNNSLIHRSVPGFIVQGGGFLAADSPNGPVYSSIATYAPVVNEFHLSNTRGTIAMAKQGGDPNSATSQWFFNESDSNAANLDNQNGGFTVFGKVADAASLAVMDQLAAVPVPNPSPYVSPFDSIPLLNYQQGAAVQFSNLVQVLSITPAAGAHVLWDNANGTTSIWSYETAGGTFTQNTYGPFAGYTAQALADGGSDGKTRVLWKKTDASVSLWSLDNLAATYTHAEFGPFAGWTAATLSVAADNTTHLLWTNTNGQVSVWNYSTASSTYTHQEYGPYPGWTAKAVADGGTDGMTRLVWDNSDGRMSLWSLNNAAGQFTQHTFGPYAGWTATAVSVGADNTTHVLWNNTDGRVSLWSYSTASGTFTQNTYGPYSGWTAVGVGDGLDGKTRLLWDNTNGTASLWSLDNTSGVFSQFSFGPYAGWTAAGEAAGS